MPKSKRVHRSRRAHEDIEIRIRPQRSLWVQLLLIVWRWRTEIVTLIALVVIYIHLTDRLGSGTAAIAVMTAPVLVVLLIPPTRRFTVGRTWCVISRHRLRACLVQVRATNWDGRLPWVIWTRPTPVGERLWLWMLPGLSVLDLENRTEVIAASCWARDARIQRTRRLATLVRVDVIRRDPLGRPKPIPNPLVDPTHRAASIDRAPVIPIQPGQPPTSPANTVSGSDNKPTHPAPAPVENGRPPVLLNGEDVSDYV
jgi:hypothetical protein